MISEYQPSPCSFNLVLIEIGRWTFNYQYYEIHDLYISSNWIKFLPPVLHLTTKKAVFFLQWDHLKTHLQPTKEL